MHVKIVIDLTGLVLFVNNAFEDRIIIERMLDKYKFINILKVKLSQ